MPSLATPTSTPSTPPHPQQRRREAILQAIHAAAVAEFSAQGFKGATTQAIAQRAGLTKPQLHYYISSKEALYRELLHGVLRSWAGAFAFGDEALGAQQVLSDYIRNKLAYALDAPELSRLFTRELMDGGPHLGDYWPEAQRHIAHKVQRIESWIAQGQLRPVDARLLLIHIWALTQHYADYELQVRQVLPDHPQAAPQREAIGQAITALVLGGALAAPAPTATQN